MRCAEKYTVSAYAARLAYRGRPVRARGRDDIKTCPALAWIGPTRGDFFCSNIRQRFVGKFGEALRIKGFWLAVEAELAAPYPIVTASS